MLLTNRPDVLEANIGRMALPCLNLMVLDGSPQGCPSVARRFSDDNGARYLHLPEMAISDRIEMALKETDTPYCVAMADDDFLAEDQVVRCVEFLESNPDYVAAQGAFWHDSSTGPVLEEYARSVETEQPLERVAELLADFSHVFYSVQRRKTFTQAFTSARSFFGAGCFFELSHAVTIAALGKIKRLPVAYCLRTPHTKEQAACKVKSHPCSWHNENEAEYKANLEAFFTGLAGMHPFDGLKDVDGRLRAAYGVYQDIAFDSRKNMALCHKYLHLLLDTLGAGAKGINALKGLDRTVLAELHVSLEKGLTLLLKEGRGLSLPDGMVVPDEWRRR
jgi:glycosyltransferase domain-containing protein